MDWAEGRKLEIARGFDMALRMIAKLTSILVLVAAPVFAAPAPAPAPAPPPSSSTPAAVNTGRVLWGNIGLYDVGISVDTGFGTFSSSSTYFGLDVGAAVNVAPLTPDIPLAIWGNAAIAFGNGGQFFPLTAGAAVRYDKLPAGIGLFGGLGLTVMPYTNGGANSPTPIGLAIQLAGFYPLPMVNPNMSADLQIAYHILNNSFSLLTFTAGVGWAF
jgi:hypothetical protein